MQGFGALVAGGEQPHQQPVGGFVQFIQRQPAAGIVQRPVEMAFRCFIRCQPPQDANHLSPQPLGLGELPIAVFGVIFEIKA